jgi:hypothetical protein
MGLWSLAGVLIPYPERGVEAVARVAPMPSDIGTDLTAIRRVKEKKWGDLIQPREVAEVELPLGPALLAPRVCI